MHRRDEIDVHGSLVLKFEQNLGQVSSVGFVPLIEPAQLVILTKEAFEIATGEKNGARTCPFAFPGLGRPFSAAAQNRFFPVMKQGVGNIGMNSASTESFFTGGSVGPTLAGTQGAFFFLGRQAEKSLFDPQNFSLDTLSG